MTADNLCSIIATCYKSGVRSLVLPGITVKFGEEVVPEAINYDPTLPDAEIETNIKRLKELEELRSKEKELEELGSTDPDELEELLEADELTNDHGNP